MRIHHVRGKVLQTGPKFQLTERMSDACVSVTFVVSLQVCHNYEIENQQKKYTILKGKGLQSNASRFLLRK